MTEGSNFEGRANGLKPSICLAWILFKIYYEIMLNIPHKTLKKR